MPLDCTNAMSTAEMPGVVLMCDLQPGHPRVPTELGAGGVAGCRREEKRVGLGLG